MHRLAILITTALFGATLPLSADDCKYTEERLARARAEGVTSVRIIARAGSLRVVGRSGVAEIRAEGLACSSREAHLSEVRLTTSRIAGELLIEAELPELSGVLFGRSPVTRLDLSVELPDHLPLSVRDSSGWIRIENVGSLRVDDGSGSIEIRDVKGDLRVNDGSGSIEIRDVAGEVVIEEDGSGGIDIRRVTGSVRVERDGSGSIHVSDVDGDFVVVRDGSGGIHHDRVKGSVRVPRH